MSVNKALHFSTDLSMGRNFMWKKGHNCVKMIFLVTCPFKMGSHFIGEHVLKVWSYYLWEMDLNKKFFVKVELNTMFCHVVMYLQIYALNCSLLYRQLLANILYISFLQIISYKFIQINFKYCCSFNMDKDRLYINTNRLSK